MKNFFILVVMNLFYFSSQGYTCNDFKKSGKFNINGIDIELIVNGSVRDGSGENKLTHIYLYDNSQIKIDNRLYELDVCSQNDISQRRFFMYLNDKGIITNFSF